MLVPNSQELPYFRLIIRYLSWVFSIEINLFEVEEINAQQTWVESFFTSCSNIESSLFLPCETENMAVLVFVILGYEIKIEGNRIWLWVSVQSRWRGHKETSFSFQPQVFIIAVIFCNCSIWVPDCELLWLRLKWWCYLLLSFFLFSALFSIDVSKLRLYCKLFSANCLIILHRVIHSHLYPFGSNYWLTYFDVEIISKLCSFL